MTEKNEVSISGQFQRLEKRSTERCPTHPYCSPGGCGFYLGQPHDWTPEKVDPIATQFSFNEHMRIESNYILPDGSQESKITRILKSGGRDGRG